MTKRERFELCRQQAANYPRRITQTNSGWHWRVDIGGEDFDFWPSTGVWLSVRTPQMRGKVPHFSELIRAVKRKAKHTKAARAKRAAAKTVNAETIREHQ